jgi:hypothetical protein
VTNPDEFVPEMSAFAAAVTSAVEELAGCVNLSGPPPTGTWSACSCPPASRLLGVGRAEPEEEAVRLVSPAGSPFQSDVPVRSRSRIDLAAVIGEVCP